MDQNITTIVFDLGGVLVDWNPRHLYRKWFDTEAEVDFFLQNICTSAWNEEQDAGRSWAEGIAILVEKHPEYEAAIRAYYDRWEEMLAGEIAGTVEILVQLHKKRAHRLYALTNWSSETFPIAEARFDFLQLFEGVLVSGREGLKKPDPKIYQLLMHRYHIHASEAFFIDDNLKNVAAAEALGIPSHHFTSPKNLYDALKHKAIV
jgi:2-haloacid dehalogenase